MYAVVTARMPQYPTQERFDAGSMRVRLFPTFEAAQEWAILNPDWITEVVMSEGRDVPGRATVVIAKCMAESWRTAENMPDATEADYAADIVHHLSTEYPTP